MVPSDDTLKRVRAHCDSSHVEASAVLREAAMRGRQIYAIVHPPRTPSYWLDRT